MIIFTSICANYTHKARVLAKSVKEHIPDATFIVCLTERELPEAVTCPYFDKIVLTKDAWEGNFDQFIFKHNIVEASTAVKGQFLKYIYNNYTDENKFVYLDPDVLVYDDFIELRKLLDTRSIIVCPHLLQPGNIDMELSSTAHGVYNLGFLAVSRSKEAERFIEWWSERLFMFCYDDIAKGIFTDQKWIDLAPCFFDVEILKHRGYDFATWSLLDCGMTEENGKVYIKGDPIRFIHYSGYGQTLNKCIRDWLPEGNHPFKKLYEEYKTIHEENDSDSVSKTPWSYARYANGSRIGDRVRVMYRNDYEFMQSENNPFLRSNQWLAIRLLYRRVMRFGEKLLHIR